MAPQQARELRYTAYGAVDLPDHDAPVGALVKPSQRPLNKLLVLASAVVMVTVGVFTLSVTNPTRSTSVVQIVDISPQSVPGSAATKGPDCQCRSPCDQTTTTTVHGTTTGEYHFCDVVPTDVCDDPDGDGHCACVGLDQRLYTMSPGYDASLPCSNEDGSATGNCRAVCQTIVGRYDCWSFPCFNDGWCIDGKDTYTCVCAFGFDGEQCENDIDECMLQDVDEEVLAVCNEHALCSNSFGTYSCDCNAGWEGDGYRAAGVLPYDIPSWITRPADDADYIDACEDIDDCLRGLCRNGATCINLVGIENGYECECAFGPTNARAWVGHDCETDVDECDPELPQHDCDPHAQCNNNPGGFTCACNEHWQSLDTDGVDRLARMFGDGLEYAGCYDYPDCSEIPCQHGGTCTEGPDGCEITNDEGEVVMVDCYACTCAYGWTGFDCDIDENECDDAMEGDYQTLPESCHGEAFCTNTPGSYECACNAGWTGDGITCIDADDCEFSPCAHGGTCYDCGTLCFTCDCVAGWRGTTCATDWNECIMGIHMCNDDATCVNNPGSYTCRCDPGFTGDGFGPGFSIHTQTYTIGANEVTETTYKGCKDIDDCDPALYMGPEESPNGPCVRGTCRDVGPNAYVCTCEVGYTDANCDQDINECDPVLGENDCHRFATCVNGMGSYTCQCNTGYTGNGYSSCLDISDCYSQCEHGFCSDLGISHYKCSCDDGWMDKDCDYDINECTTYTHQCANHALCSNTAGSYTCACNIGYTGDGMAQGGGCRDIDDCASDPCDYGECTDVGAAAYRCTCQEGYTDFNCDFDINECYLKTHDCHVDARCVNEPGGWFCRCLSGWEGDGLTCTDLDDCDPDPCDPIHGTCEDLGPNSYVCNCMPGWTGIECGDDENECSVGTHGCDPYASCTNSFGSHSCACRNDFFGDGTLCTPCTVCPAGWKEEGVCEAIDLDCVNVDECITDVDNCHEHATCYDNEGSFKCECDQKGEDDEWWGIGIDTNDGCSACTDCFDGYHEIQPCTSTTNRICQINLAEGLYMVESEADDNRMCMAMLQGEWYPSRANWGNGEQFCGVAGDDAETQRKELLGDGQAVFKFNHIGNKNDQEIKSGGDMYTIEHNDGNGYRCLFFANGGKDLYPSLQSCDADADIGPTGCPWGNVDDKVPYCGFSMEGMDALTALLDNGQAVWRITPLKLSENKFLLQSASKGREDRISGEKVWECLAFEEQGAATNPSRYNWGNGDSWCGAGDWNGRGKENALMTNKQAVFILTFLSTSPN
jgi:hypothetical protein